MRLSTPLLKTLTGTIERRVLINFRVDPEIAAELLPAPLTPAIVGDHAVAGICVIQLKVRPSWAPKATALRSINGAHRIAALLPDGSPAVYVPRRDTNARLNVVAGGRLFPGKQNLASITFEEDNGEIAVELEGDDTRMSVAGRATARIPQSSVFGSISEVSDFFELGSLGFSDTAEGRSLDGIELRTDTWSVQALEVDHADSSYFNDLAVFPAGSVEFDNALLMRNIDHTWHRRSPLELA